jgi:hypothetical protein
MRRARLIPLVLSVIVTTVARRELAAQWQWTTDVGLSRLNQQRIETSDALTVGTALDVYGDRGWLRTSALGARATMGRLTGQGVVVGSVLGPSGHAARWEVSGSASAFAETGTGPTTSVAVTGGARFGAALAGASFAVGGGLTRTSLGLDANGMFLTQAAVWRLVSDDAFGFNGAFVQTRRPTVATNGRLTSDLIAYADLTAAWRRDHHGWSANVSFGARGFASGVSSDVWAAGEAAAWVTRRIALVASAGRALEDPIRGVPSARYIGASVRIAAQPHERLGEVTAPRVIAGRERLEIDLPSATTVELMADFTGWTPVPLTRAGSVWRLERPIAPGLHRVAIRVDGGEWTAPPGLPRATDDLGGVVGLITVP